MFPCKFFLYLGIYFVKLFLQQGDGFNFFLSPIDLTDIDLFQFLEVAVGNGLIFTITLFDLISFLTFFLYFFFECFCFIFFFNPLFNVLIAFL